MCSWQRQYATTIAEPGPTMYQLLLEQVPAAQLDAARRAFGTDEDILLVDVAPLDAIDLEAALEQRQQLEQADQQKQQQQCQAEDSVPVLSPPSLERTSAPLLL